MAQSAQSATATIELFSVLYRPSATTPALRLLCQAVNVGDEKLLWIDGTDVEQPIMIPLASVTGIQWVGSFREFMSDPERIGLAAKVIDEARGEQSPTLMARAVLYMSRDRSLSAEEALDLALDQGTDLIDADNMSRFSFSTAAAAASARSAAAAGQALAS